jgi:serine/threonine-protein kinase
VLRALVKDPDYRYQSADEMRADIEACLDGQPVAATAAMGSVGYGGYPDDQPTTALRADGGGGATTMLPPMNPDDGGYGYDERPDRRRQKNNNTSTILLVVAGVLVLVGAILIGKWMFSGNGGAGNGDVPVPNLVGQSLPDARQLTTNAELKIGNVSRKPCDNQQKGSICSQDPAFKTEVKKGTAIDVVVSTGAPKVAVPNVINKDVDAATQELENKGFNVKTKQTESSQPEGTVLSQNPDPGTELEKGSDVTLEVAKAAATTTVPDVTNQTCDAAKQQMQASGLTGTCTEVNASDPNQIGKVIQTVPSANSTVKKGSSVNIQVGQQAQNSQVAVPNIRGQKLKDVKQMLAQSGLQVGNISGPQDDNAIVANSDPAPGQPVAQGTAVNLVTVGGNGGNNGSTNFFGGVTG